ncbi:MULTISPECIES: FAD/NAD(P)-binding protein [unclassified Brachybacterium]|uniref:FAD/NAD(P)-binding protein n=1 Tax=unclassified Brachybacterium TaxID=2623841 RepID=UPI003F99E722
MTGADATGPRRRLAVVGAGPKALFALEALAAHLTADLAAGAGAGAVSTERAGAAVVDVTVLDPAGTPGTGAAYALDQPPYLRLNVSAGILDAPATGTGTSFPSWVRREHPGLAEDPYPPRAVVGAYLTQRWGWMEDALSPAGTLCHLRCRVVSVEPRDGRWRVGIEQPATADGAASWDATTDGAAPREMAPTLLDRFDEVLLATGHAARHHGALARSWSGPLPLRPAVLPVKAMLGPEQVPPGARVAVRGAALTFLDAALALTEGRGGRFDPDPRRERTVVHIRGAEEPATILPIARHGLLLDAKPDPGTPLPPAGAAAIEDGKRRLRAATSSQGEIARDVVLDVVLDAATAMLRGAGASAAERYRAVEHTLATGAEPDLPSGPGRAERALRRSVSVAEGARAPGPAWALGRTWSALYPLITAGLRGSDMTVAEWEAFRRTAQVLERFAFGPPLVNARKLLAMLDSGAVDLSWLEAGTAIDARGLQGIPHGAGAADLVVDAVLSPPGVVGIADELTEHLLRSGLVSVRPGRRGAVVDPDATARRADGSRAEGLALLGRPTEDHVIGHDTLNRHLHTEIQHWAARLAHTLRDPVGRAINRPVGPSVEGPAGGPTAGMMGDGAAEGRAPGESTGYDPAARSAAGTH